MRGRRFLEKFASLEQYRDGAGFYRPRRGRGGGVSYSISSNPVGRLIIGIVFLGSTGTQVHYMISII